ncbi:hypothetical protein [Deinococcus knuensis]|uniref:Uncharacterized protein n=1 Tax=Deinococcus knuensis TaxID=1837380 RepID=A0ABQ2SQ15_9DEIO|nr:hypothetical protein [Deinococcus knuensis]GGS36747.1 hypothetical protein GCM10008961_30480 [Deinococcus knuensis]
MRRDDNSLLAGRMTRPPTTHLGLNDYLIHCMQISLLKRWWQPPLALTAAAIFALLCGAHPLTTALLGMLAAVMSVTWILVSSWRRHRFNQPVALNFPDTSSA